ncbi:unnamed protein product [Caenorhabditis auriculariae]|uniref:Transmembrane protein n=1 Tax=Caenorhabditis auriculariae TaxID=2777116 RepID=A0A8S1GV98_9PELO|nr:unnamed protein product [Caenorhabditis auriculariae]
MAFSTWVVFLGLIAVASAFSFFDKDSSESSSSEFFGLFDKEKKTESTTKQSDDDDSFDPKFFTQLATKLLLSGLFMVALLAAVATSRRFSRSRTQLQNEKETPKEVV